MSGRERESTVGTGTVALSVVGFKVRTIVSFVEKDLPTGRATETATMAATKITERIMLAVVRRKG
jgi:hypothetical protein